MWCPWRDRMPSRNDARDLTASTDFGMLGGRRHPRHHSLLAGPSARPGGGSRAKTISLARADQMGAADASQINRAALATDGPVAPERGAYRRWREYEARWACTVVTLTSGAPTQCSRRPPAAAHAGPVSSASAPSPGTTSSAGRAPGCPPRRADGGRRSASRPCGSCHSRGNGRQVMARWQSALRGS
jgi:hypothetical protein